MNDNCELQKGLTDVLLLLFTPRFPHSRVVRRRCRRRAARDPAADLGGACRAGAGGNERREAFRADSRRDRAVGRQRRFEHRGAVCRCGVLPRAAEARHSCSRRDQDFRRLRISPVDGWLRAHVQRRRDGGRPRMRVRSPEPVAFFFDGLLAYRRAEWRRTARMAGPIGRSALRGRHAQRHREPRKCSVAGRPEPEAFTAGVR